MVNTEMLHKTFKLVLPSNSSDTDLYWAHSLVKQVALKECRDNWERMTGSHDKAV